MEGRACGECTVCCTVMAVPELHKPNRRACTHVCDEGCAIHAERPQDCRDFHCLWLRGAVGDGERERPDQLGVMFDQFTRREDGSVHTIAFEAWNGALAERAAREVVEALAERFSVALSYRDGRWSEVSG